MQASMSDHLPAVPLLAVVGEDRLEFSVATAVDMVIDGAAIRASFACVCSLAAR